VDVLVIGSGGREYELARQLALSKQVSKVYVAPGNAGTAVMAKGENVPIGPTEVQKITDFVSQNKIALTVIGPDAAVAAGVGNALRAAGATVFGPTREAGKLEASKTFAGDFMDRHGIPHPKSWTARTLDEALKIISDKSPETYVLKADGLASGKGVVLPQTTDEAQQTLKDMFSGDGFEGAGKDVVQIQERLHGPEVSAFAVSDGKSFILLPFSQDHKLLKDNDQGPNTGGMGVFSPLPEQIISKDQAQKIRAIAEQTIANMAKEGTPYQGALYLGLMLAKERGGEPVVIEYNARFGDPENQVILPILQMSGFDVADMLLQTAKGDVAGLKVPTIKKCALTVALASAGYPESPVKGDEIMGLNKEYGDVIVQHAGTKQEGGKWLTNGGRVLYVTGLGDSPDEAAAKAYAAIGQNGIHFDGMQYRRDIGHQVRS
jgi:phosphoribosylamine--glycine ligase